MLFKFGDQLPVMLLFDFVGKGSSVAPEQMGATAVNVGVTLELTVTLRVVPTTQPGPVAVKV